MYSLRIIMFTLAVLTASGGTIPTENFSLWKPTDQSAQTFQALPPISLSRFGSSHNENGASLTSLAYNAAVEAKTTAHNQDSSVGSQAAYDVKRNLANVAAGAAKTAQAALIGKKAILSNIKRQLSDAKYQLEQKISQYQKSRISANTAHDDAQRAQEQLHILASALTKAQANAQQISTAAADVANTEAVQKAMVNEAKQKVANLISQLMNAYADVREIEASAAKADKAARLAQSSAASSAPKFSDSSSYSKWY